MEYLCDLAVAVCGSVDPGRIYGVERYSYEFR